MLHYAEIISVNNKVVPIKLYKLKLIESFN